MLHHTGRSGLPRGTTAREDNIDVSILLKRPDGYSADEGARFVVHFTKNRANEDFYLLAPTEFHLVKHGFGGCEWNISLPGTELQHEVIRLHKDGLSNSQIAKELEKNTGTISKILKKAESRGWLDNDANAREMLY